MILKLFKNTEIATEDWKMLLEKSSYSSPFQTPEFYNLYNSVSNISAEVFAIEEGSELKALCVVVVLKEHGLKKYFSNRAIIYGNPILTDNNTIVLDYLLESINSEFNKKVIYIEIRNTLDISNLTEIFTKNSYKYWDHLDIIVNLNKSEDELWREVHKNRKKEIKNGLNKGLKVNLVKLRDTDYLPSIYSILNKLYKRIGHPLPSYDFFKLSVQFFESDDLMKAFCAFVENELVGFRLVLIHKKMIYDWYAASDDKFLDYRPNDILPWEIIKWGKKNNFKIFDFGGAGEPNVPYGVRDYKLKFGGTVVNYGRYFRINKPILFTIGKIGFRVLKKIQ